MDTIAFGSLDYEESKNTSLGTPAPFEIQNDGNCIINISMNASALFNTKPSASDNFRFKIDNKTGEEGSFGTGTIIDWAQVPIASPSIAIAIFNNTDSNDIAEIDLLVTVPDSSEGTGARSTTMYYTASLAE